MNLEPSSEQLAIIQAAGEGKSVAVDAVAGSGKTTTILFLADKYPGKTFLLLTYNARLKLEVRQKASELQLKNLEVHTYHSFRCEIL